MDSWVETTLEEIATVSGGNAFKSSEYTREGRFILRTLNIRKDGSLTREKAKFIAEDAADKYSNFELQVGDTLFVMVGATLGKIGLVGPEILPALLNQNMWVIRARSENLYPKFLHYLFKTITKNAVDAASGAARSFLKRNDIRKLPVLLPPLEEQKRIVTVLDAAFEGLDRARAHTEANLQNARDLFNVLLEKIFTSERNVGSELYRLQDIVTFKGGGTPSKKNNLFWGGDVPWVSPKDMKFEIISDSRDKITEDALNQSAANEIPIGSTLVVVRSGILARTIPTGITSVRLAVNQDIKALIPSEKIVSEYLGFYMRAKESFLLEKVTRGATVHRLTTDTLKELEVNLPSIDVQMNIVSQAKVFDLARHNFELNYKTKLTDLDDLRQSLLQKAFAGELT